MEHPAQRMEALKRLYSDVILNTTKEAAVRIMGSERKAVCFQHKLVCAKEEALGMLVRLKQVMDAKIADMESTSLRQRLKIEELEAQLHEAEDVVIDLRAQLDQVQNELEDMRKTQKKIYDERIATSSAVSHENLCHAKVLNASETFSLPLQDAGKGFENASSDEQKTGGGGCSSSKVVMTPIEWMQKFIVKNSCVGNHSIASKTMAKNDSGLDRNGYKTTNEPEPNRNRCKTTNEPELDRNECKTTSEPELDTNECKTPNEPEPDRNRCKTTNESEPEPDRNGCKSTNEPEPEPEPDRNGCNTTTTEPEPDRNGCETINEPEPESNGGKTTNEPGPDRNGCKPTNESEPDRNGCTQRIHAIKQNLVSGALSLPIQKDNQDSNINVRSTIKEYETAEMSCDVPSSRQKNLRLTKKKPTGLVDSLGQDISFHKGQDVKFTPRISLRKSTSKYKKPLVLSSANQVIQFCGASILSKANSCPSSTLAESGESRKAEKEVDKNLDVHPVLSLDETNTKPPPKSMHDPGYKTEMTKSVNIQNAAASGIVSVNMPELARQGGDTAGVLNCWRNYETDDLTTDSASKERKTCSANETTTQTTNDRFLKYTFQRKRKKGTLSCPDETDSREQNSVKKRAGEKQIGALEPPNLIIESSRGGRRLVQVARQLISMSDKRW